MPIYFSDIPAYCPISRDQPLGPMPAYPIRIRTTIPRAHDLASAIAAVNIARTIINQIVFSKTINNVYTPPAPKPRTPPADRIIDKQRYSRWVERKDLRVKRRYKYYSQEDADTWVMTERLERVVWYDRAWKTYLVFQYGEKGEGVPVGNSTGGGSGTSVYDMGGEAGTGNIEAGDGITLPIEPPDPVDPDWGV